MVLLHCPHPEHYHQLLHGKQVFLYCQTGKHEGFLWRQMRMLILLLDPVHMGNCNCSTLRVFSSCLDCRHP